MAGEGRWRMVAVAGGEEGEEGAGRERTAVEEEGSQGEAGESRKMEVGEVEYHTPQAEKNG